MSAHGGPEIVTSGLVLDLDAGNVKSYPGSGSVVTDISGTGNTGTKPGGVTVSGGAFVLDGSGAGVSAANNSSLNLTGNMALSVWVKLGNVTNNYQSIVGKRNAASTPCNYLLRTGGALYSDPNQIQYGYYDSTWHILGTTAANLGAATWYNVTGVHNGASDKIYLNGVDMATTWRWGTASGTLTTDANAFFLGSSGYTGEYMTGSVAIGSLYNRALTAAEVLQNFNANRKRFGL